MPPDKDLKKPHIIRRIVCLLRYGYDPAFEKQHIRIERLEEDLRKMDERAHRR
jgi:hypothetical protein